MRTSLFAAALALGVPVALAAQTPPAAPPPGAWVGFMAGVNSTTFGGRDATNPRPGRRTAFVGGAYLVAPFRPGSTFAFRPELLYAQKGATGFDAAVVKVNYLELPLLLQYTAPTRGAVRPQLYAGPSVAFNLSCRAEATGGGTAISTSCDDQTDAAGVGVKTVDVGAAAGAALAFRIGARDLTLGVRYTRGLGTAFHTGDLNNRALGVYSSVELPIGRLR